MHETDHYPQNLSWLFAIDIRLGLQMHERHARTNEQTNGSDTVAAEPLKLNDT